MGFKFQKTIFIGVVISLFTTGCSQFGEASKSSDNFTVTKEAGSYKTKAVHTEGELFVRGEIEIEGPFPLISSSNIKKSGNEINGLFSAIESSNNQRSVSVEELVQSVDIERVFDSGLILTKNGDILEVQGGEEFVSTKIYPFSFDEKHC